MCPVRLLLSAARVERQRLPDDPAAGLRLAEPKAERPGPVVGKPWRSRGQQFRRAECGTDGGGEHRIAPREECVRRQGDRHLRIDRNARVVGSRLLPVDPRDAQLETRGGQERVDGVAVEIRATTARLPDEDGVRHPLEVGGEILGRGEGHPRDEHDDPLGLRSAPQGIEQIARRCGCHRRRCSAGRR